MYKNLDVSKSWTINGDDKGIKKRHDPNFGGAKFRKVHNSTKLEVISVDDALDCQKWVFFPQTASELLWGDAC